MTDEQKATCIQQMAASASIPLRAEAPARIARAVKPTVERFQAEKISPEMETEPSTFAVISMREIGR